jgi:transcriptional regulator EpsA
MNTPADPLLPLRRQQRPWPPDLTGEGLNAAQGESLVRLIEASVRVLRRHQFFGWTQSHLHALLPHVALVCGSYQRQQRALRFEAFQNVVISPRSLRALDDAQGPWLSALCAAWVDGQSRPLLMDLTHFMGASADPAQLLRLELGEVSLLVHGVARPMRQAEIETLFLLLMPPCAGVGTQRLRLIEFVLPLLHIVWLRVLSTEAEFKFSPATLPRTVARVKLTGTTSAISRDPASGAAIAVTTREGQILRWVRAGKSNQQIGEVLSISPLTVKNHVQKILRKLGASNRAQAVAIATKFQLLDGDEM